MVGSEDNHHFMMVAAATLKGGIGFKGQLPWRIPQVGLCTWAAKAFVQCLRRCR